MKKALLGIFIISAVTSLVFIFTSLTLAIFTENETSQNNAITTALESRHLVINEVYYDPNDEHEVSTGPIDSEWVEIHNPTSYTFNLKDWKITDNTGTERTISFVDRNLGPGEFVILARTDEVRVIWGIEEAKFIALGTRIGSGLNNDGDVVILKNNEDSVVDQMSYDDNTTAFDPPAPDVTEGHSIERDPNGVDTDTAADFLDRNPPTPTL